MKTTNTSVLFFLTMAKIQAMLSRRFDGGLGGLGLNEFTILYALSQAPDEKLRRIDLAGKVGLTASGVTRILLPMEKIGLIKKETHAQDARVSFVSLAPGGKQKLIEAIERAELLAADIIPQGKIKKIEEFSELLNTLGGTIL
jgi:DNA-binding MarR family transcriptional regulator